ncbi:hypothetical protein RRG08_013060 [Elysia crispata]|uniref:Uncharacterized protein n=1 Tax=Elysia crispata TaxID=231223 RepID=A0AAE1A0Q3_9GAST|nr:hypothetical protein RRG08_013060 [Elysia crispata]
MAGGDGQSEDDHQGKSCVHCVCLCRLALRSAVKLPTLSWPGKTAASSQGRIWSPRMLVLDLTVDGGNGERELCWEPTRLASTDHVMAMNDVCFCLLMSF